MGDYNTDQRRQMAKKGQALPGSKAKPGNDGGRFPINDADDLRKAIALAGNAKGDPSAIRAYIKRRAAALGLSSRIPEDWK